MDAAKGEARNEATKAESERSLSPYDLSRHPAPVREKLALGRKMDPYDLSSFNPWQDMKS